jgi:hypothetical protein
MRHREGPVVETTMGDDAVGVNDDQARFAESARQTGHLISWISQGYTTGFA